METLSNYCAQVIANDVKVDAEVEVRQYQYGLLLVRVTGVPLVNAVGVVHASKLLTPSDHPVGTVNVGVTETVPPAVSNASLPAPPVVVQVKPRSADFPAISGFVLVFGSKYKLPPLHEVPSVRRGVKTV